MAPWCNPLTLQPEQSGGVGSNPGRAPPLERHDKGSIRSALFPPPFERHDKGSIRSALFLLLQRLALKNATSPSPLSVYCFLLLLTLISM